MLRITVASLALSVVVAAQTPVQNPPVQPPQGQAAGQGQGRGGGRGPQISQAERRQQEVENQVKTDDLWRRASEGYMKMEKTTYKSKVDGMTIPVFVFTPLKPRGPKAHPALVWVHPDIRGHVYEYYFPYIREAVKKGFVVVAPEYRGSYGYGAAHYDAIDYGGAEVEDVTTAVDFLKAMPIVDPARIGIIGWSHGGMITMLSIEREPAAFKAAVAMVPVSNLFQRLAWNGVEQRKQSIDPQDRIGGLPYQKHDEYKRRSPVYGVDKIQIPVLVHITRNDQDVVIEEAQQLVDALIARKPKLAETKIYEDPIGGHLFDRMCPATLPPGNRTAGAARPDPWSLDSYTPTNTPEQVDSWKLVWDFLDRNFHPKP